MPAMIDPSFLNVHRSAIAVRLSTGALETLVSDEGSVPQEGGGVFQTFTTTGGLATFAADIAAFYTRTSGASGLGLMSVLRRNYRGAECGRGASGCERAYWSRR
jgi:hypothetical protein